ncbi:MAG TPA: YXWGXW repeat-containing protein [Ramlibacter sp.]
MKKHIKLIAAVATAGGLFAMSSAHAIAPAAAAGIAALAGAAVGTAAAQANPPALAVVPSAVPAPAVTVVPNTVVMGAAPAVQEVIPAPRAGYRWDEGHYEIRNGVTMWVPGHWVATDAVIYQE